MLNIFKKIFGTKQDRDMGKYQVIVAEINNHFESFQSISNDDLRQKTLEFRARIADYLRTLIQRLPP